MIVNLFIGELDDYINVDVTYHYFHDQLQIDSTYHNGHDISEQINDIEHSELESLVEHQHNLDHHYARDMKETRS